MHHHPGWPVGHLFLLERTVQYQQKKQHHLYLVSPPEALLPNQMDPLTEEFFAEFVQVPFDFDSLPDEEEPCARS